MKRVKSNHWGFIELQKDSNFKYFKQKDKENIILISEAFGKNVAENIIKKFGNPNNFIELNDIVNTLGGKVIIYEKSFSPVYLAEYNEKNKEITCYKMNIEKYTKRLGKNHEVLKRYNLLTICVAHELFHHIENINTSKASYKIRLERSFCKIIKYHIKPESAREIAAHAFVQELLGIDVSSVLIEM